MAHPSLDVQLRCLRRAAKRRGLRVRKDDRLRKTPYRAMNPRAAKELKQPCLRRTITYIESEHRPKHRMVIDIRHELIEYDKLGRGWRYRKGHRFANRRQQTIGAAGEGV